MRLFRQFVIDETAWKLGKGECMNERVWFDAIASWFGRQVFHKDYEHALHTLHDVILRKEKSGTLRHTVGYYAERVAKSYANVDGYELANMYKEVFPE